MLRDVAGLVLHVPPEVPKEGVQEFITYAGFVVVGAFVVGQVAGEDFDELAEFVLERSKVGVVWHQRVIMRNRMRELKHQSGGEKALSDGQIRRGRCKEQHPRRGGPPISPVGKR